MSDPAQILVHDSGCEFCLAPDWLHWHEAEIDLESPPDDPTCRICGHIVTWDDKPEKLTMWRIRLEGDWLPEKKRYGWRVAATYKDRFAKA